MMPRRALPLFALVTSTVTARAAEPYPTRPIRIFVPSAPGGLSDVFVRMIGDSLQSKWGQPVVMDFKAGAGGIVGTEHVSSAPPDGYTLLMGNNGPLAVNPSLYARLPYDSANLAAIALVATYPNVLVVGRNSPIRNVRELVDVAKGAPGTINFASAGIGQSQHLSGELFARATNTRLVHVPYRGTNPALTDLMGGSVQIMFSNVPATVGLIQSEQVRPLAVTSRQRVPILPDVPTFAEAGIDNFEVVSWLALVGPPGLPDHIVERFNREVVAICNAPEQARRYFELGASPSTYTSGETHAFIQAERQKWAAVIGAAGIRAE